MIKKIAPLLLIVFILFSFKQDNSKTKPFIGIWYWKNDTIKFNIEIYESFDLLKGNYWLTETKNGNERIIYKSDKIIDNFFDIKYGNAITGNSKDGKFFTGIIKDNTLIDDGIHGIKEGEFWFTLLDSNTAKWKVKNLHSLDKKRKITPSKFTIPTDIILIRQKK